jgi:hypothetical protein
MLLDRFNVHFRSSQHPDLEGKVGGYMVSGLF